MTISTNYPVRFIPKDELYDIIDSKMRALGYTLNDYPIDPFEVANKLNIEIRYLDYGTSKVGGQIFLGDEIKRIILNCCRNKKEQNFDISHEIAHAFCHPKDICNFKLNQNSAVEWQANNGAAQLIMPKVFFVKQLFNFNFDVKKLSNFFKVSKKAIIYRIKSLDVFDKNTTNEHIIKYCPNCMTNNNRKNNTLYCNECGEIMKEVLVTIDNTNVIVSYDESDIEFCYFCMQFDINYNI